MSRWPRWLAFASLCLVAGLPASGGAAQAADAKGFVPLFDGKTLDGWQGDTELWSVEDGMIVGTTDNKRIGHNSFLSTDKTYKNFVLKVKFKLRNGNSGIQFRSKRKADHVVEGFQADIADKRYMGILYYESSGPGRGILHDVDPEKVAQHVNRDGWNEYVITADGPHITQVLNGYKTVDYRETSPLRNDREGVIALQLHVGPPMRIWFKDIAIKELP